MFEFQMVAKKFSLRCQYLYHQLEAFGRWQALSQKLRMDLQKLNSEREGGKERDRGGRGKERGKERRKEGGKERGREIG